MELNELLQGYLAITSEESKNLMNIAFDEMNSSQYEEAATHFDQLYVKDSNDFMSYFFRAYCKSHCGRRGDVYSDSQKLTSAFELACKKSIASKKNLDVDLLLLLKMYDDAMDNLAYNAVEEVSIDSNGNSHTSNPTKYKIMRETKVEIVDFLKTNVDVIKEYADLKDYALSYLKGIVDSNLETYGPIIVAYDPSYQSILDEKIQTKKKKKTIKTIVWLSIIAIIVIIIIVSATK